MDVILDEIFEALDGLHVLGTELPIIFFEHLLGGFGLIVEDLVMAQVERGQLTVFRDDCEELSPALWR